VADGIILEDVDVTFEILRRRAGAADLAIASWQNRFDHDPDGGYRAVAYEARAQAPAVDVEAGDLLIFRYTGQSAELGMAYVPNGEGERTGGRIPFLDLPR
jgi:hypothetical protein